VIAIRRSAIVAGFVLHRPARLGLGGMNRAQCPTAGLQSRLLLLWRQLGAALLASAPDLLDRPLLEVHISSVPNLGASLAERSARLAC
jgi:hypothetical protein